MVYIKIRTDCQARERKENNATTFKFSHNYNITDFTCLILMVFKCAMCCPGCWLWGPGVGQHQPQHSPGLGLSQGSILLQTFNCPHTNMRRLGAPCICRHPDAPFHSSYSGLWVTQCSQQHLVKKNIVFFPRCATTESV